MSSKAETQSFKGSAAFYGFIRAVLYSIYRLFFSFRYQGVQNVPPDTDPRGVILAPNHASFLDPPILGISLKRRVTFLAKDYLFKNFIVGAVLRGVGAYPIKSGADDFRSIRDLVRILKAGKCVVVFPEGTRSADGNFKNAEGGIGFLAMKSGASIVPVYIEGSYKAYPKGAKFFKCSPVKAYFGKPFVPSLDEEFSKMESPYQAVADRIMVEIKKIKHDVDTARVTV